MSDYTEEQYWLFGPQFEFNPAGDIRDYRDHGPIFEDMKREAERRMRLNYLEDDHIAYAKIVYVAGNLPRREWTAYWNINENNQGVITWTEGEEIDP